MLYSIVGILVIILDQLVKYWVDKNINWTHPTIELIPKVLSLVRVQNDGAAFSFLSGGSARIWFIVLTAVFALLVVLALATNFVSGRFGRWCLVLITAGGLSNMIDRVRFGYVIDMFKFELFDFAVFNVADIFITVFAIAFILYILFGGEKEREADADEFDEDDFEEEIRSRRSRPSVSRAKYEDDEEELQPERTRRQAKSASDTDDVQSVRKVRPTRSSSAKSTPAGKPSRTPTAPVRSNTTPQGQRPRTSSADSQRPVQRQRPRTISQETEQEVAIARSKAAASSSDAMFEEMFAHKPAQNSPNAAQPSHRPTSAVSSSSAKRTASSQKSTNSASRSPVNPKKSDPFEEWEQANVRVKSDAKTAYRQATEAASRSKSGSGSSTSGDAFSDFIAASTAQPAEKAVSKPAKSLQVSDTPRKNASPDIQPKSPKTVSADEFDLDSILNEFK